jgi:hypothetical protein
MPSIDLTLPLGALRLTENDVEKDFDGGRIVLTGDNSEAAKTPSNPSGDKLTEDLKIMAVSVVINYRKDEPMRDWPSIREDIAKRRFSIRIWEEPQQ